MVIVSKLSDAPGGPAARLAGRCAAVLAGVLLIAGGAGAAVDPQAPAVAGAPSAEQIVERNAQARGGLAAWRALQTLSEKGRIEHGQLKGPKSRHGTPGPSHGALDQSLPFTLQIKRPHKVRQEMKLGDAAALQVFDGTRGWTLQPAPGGPLLHAFSAAEAAAFAEQVDPEGPLIDALAKGSTVRLDGEDVVEGRRAYRLLLTLKSGAQRHVWVDAQSFLDVKIDGSRLIDGKAWPVETYFYDWRAVAGGLQLPFRIETAVQEVRNTTRILVDKVLVNAPLGDDLFDLPGKLPAAGERAP